MKMKKIIAMGMVLAMMTSVLTACGDQSVESTTTNDSSSVVKSEQSVADTSESEQKEEEGIVFPLEEKMTFTGFASMNGEYALDGSVAWQAALERANIDIELTNVLSADLTEKRNLILASNEYPEVFLKAGLNSQDTINNYGDILIPLEDLIKEYAPNLTSWLDEVDGWQYITNSDGHVYTLPTANQIIPEGYAFWINKKWLDNLGLKEPTSFEELYDVLIAFKEKDANGNGVVDDEIPLTFCTAANPTWLLNYSDYQYDPWNMQGVRNNEMFYAPIDDSFKDFLKLTSTMYNEGIMDKNSFTQDWNQMCAVGQSDDVYGAFWASGSFQVSGRDNDDDYIILTPFQDGTYNVSKPVTNQGMLITDACEHPEVLVAWADYFYTQEGAVLARMGIEDVTYKVNADGTWEWILSEEYGSDVTTLRAKSMIMGGQQFPAIIPDMWYDISSTVDPDESYLNEERARIAAMGAPSLPVISYSEEEVDKLITIIADVTAYVNQYVAEVITGQKNVEDTWDEYLSTLKDMRVDEMNQIYKEAYERATAK